MDTSRIKHLAASIVDPSGGAWLLHLISVACAAAASFVIPVKHYLLLIGALVLCDMYTGWRASGKVFNSKGMGGTIEKVVLYMLAILICRGVDLSFGLGDTLGVTTVTAGVIVSRELLSNLENIGKVTGLDLVSEVKAFIGKLFKR